ncbi:TIGR01244 family sulfur transferase [Hydrogenophaga sp. XSHU_21]
MDLKRLTPDLSVTAQIGPADLSAIAALGFTTVICNRPDGEQPGQPDHDTLAQAARALGLRFHHQPVITGQVTPDQGKAFGELLAQAGGPVLAYCRSGMRCTTLWAYANADRQPWQDLLNTAAQAGYDLSRLQPPVHRR